MNDLLKALMAAKENRCVENDLEFSRLLGIDRSTWSKIKSGKREIGNEVLSRILVKLPELTKDVMAYMKQLGNTEGAPDALRKNGGTK